MISTLFRLRETKVKFISRNRNNSFTVWEIQRIRNIFKFSIFRPILRLNVTLSYVEIKLDPSTVKINAHVSLRRSPITVLRSYSSRISLFQNIEIIRSRRPTYIRKSKQFRLQDRCSRPCRSVERASPSQRAEAAARDTLYMPPWRDQLCRILGSPSTERAPRVHSALLSHPTVFIHPRPSPALPSHCSGFSRRVTQTGCRVAIARVERKTEKESHGEREDGEEDDEPAGRVLLIFSNI